LATSGSVSLELLYQRKPTVILYSISKFAYWVMQRFNNVRYITLVNLLTAKELFLREGELAGTWGQKLSRQDQLTRDKAPEKALFPEYLTYEDRSAQIAGHLIRWLLVEEYQDSAAAELGKLKARIAHGGASRNAANLILSEVPDRTRLPLRVHHDANTPATLPLSRAA
jgi:lipid-A-disaccharide synthase